MFVLNKLHLYIVVSKNAIVDNHFFYVNGLSKVNNEPDYPECNEINTSPVGFCLERDYSHNKYTPEFISYVKETDQSLEQAYRKGIITLVNGTEMEMHRYRFVLGPFKCDVDNGSIYVHIKRNDDDDDDDDYHICFEPDISIINKETLSNIPKLKWYVYRFNAYSTLNININGSKITRKISFHSTIKEKINKYCYYDANWNLTSIKLSHDTDLSIPHVDIIYKRNKTILKIAYYNKESNTEHYVCYEKIK